MMLLRTLTLLAGVTLAAPAAAQSPASHPSSKPAVAEQQPAKAPPPGDTVDAELDELESMAPPAPAALPPAPSQPKPQPRAKSKAPRAQAQPGTTWAEPARVEPSDAADDDEIEGERRWYGGYTLGVDGASLLLVLAAGSGESAGLAALGLGGYVFGGPIVHAAHGNPGRAVGSLGLRIGLPLLGVAIATSSQSDCESDDGFCELGEAALGFGSGILGAMLIDGIAIARDTVPREPPAANIGFSMGRDHALLVASGRF